MFNRYLTKRSLSPAAVADPDPWPVMAPVAFHGLAGEIISVLAPETEADPVALLLHFLVIFGNILGRKPCCRWSSKRHFPVTLRADHRPNLKSAQRHRSRYRPPHLRKGRPGLDAQQCCLGHQ